MRMSVHWLAACIAGGHFVLSLAAFILSVLSEFRAGLSDAPTHDDWVVRASQTAYPVLQPAVSAITWFWTTHHPGVPTPAAWFWPSVALCIGTSILFGYIVAFVVRLGKRPTD